MPALHVNNRTNAPWGDPLAPKENNITRIYSLNLNGLALDRRGGQFDTLCRIAREVQADIVCCQEHNVDTTNSTVKSILYQTSTQHWRRSRLQFGTTNVTFTNWYKPGGTMLISTGDITGRIQAQSSDPMGRWVTQTFTGQNGVKKTILSAYQVATDNPHAGLTTATSQQRSILISNQDPIVEPRKAFKRNLRDYISKCRERGEEMLIVGDFNESLDGAYNGMCKLMTDFHLVDLMKMRSAQSVPATYTRGPNRLDYGLATHKVAEALTAAGYEAFNQRYPTDHRAYFFDFNTDLLFGSKTQVLASPVLRRLHSTNVVQVTAYIRELYAQLQQCNAFLRGDQLSHSGNRHIFTERLDKNVVNSSLSAEKRMKHFREPAWSVALAAAREKVVLLKKCQSMIRTGLDCTTALQNAIERGVFKELVPTNHIECSRQLRCARAEVESIIKESIARRDKEHEDKIAELEASIQQSDKETAKRLRRIKRAEAIKRLFEMFKFFRNPGQRRGVTRLEIPEDPDDDPKTCVTWRVIDVPTEIVAQLQIRNRKHFGQAHGTPFTLPPFSTGMGYTGEGPLSEQILNGTAEFPDLSQDIQLFIQHMRRSTEIEASPCCPTIEKECIGKLEVWRESTTTSPSGLHLGHYKSLISRHSYSTVEDNDDRLENGRSITDIRDKLNFQQNAIRRLHVQMMNYALERGYSYKRWQTVANSILFKDVDSVKIHRTRVIHIYEADYNLILGIKWRHALYRSEMLNLLNKGQFGSRPRRNAVDPVMLEELQFEISRSARRDLIQTNYDATACYDRMIPNLAMLASRKHGVHELVTYSNAGTLEQAKFHVRTEVGLSETSYSHEPQNPVYGTGQGSGNSGNNWNFISSALLDCYDTKASPATYINPDRSNPSAWSMVGFVDDNNGQVNSFSEPRTQQSLPLLHHQARQNATVWANLLSVTGGTLELSKCSYHVMNWNFSMTGAPVLQACPPEFRTLQVRDAITGQIQTLEYLTPHKAHKTLGVYKEPAGIQTEQFRQLKQKSDSVTQFLWSVPLKREETRLFYHACYLTSIGYPLTSTYFTHDQLDKIQRKAMAIIVARCGYNRNTKKELLYGLIEYGGADFYHLYRWQGYQQIKYFLRQLRLNTPVGNMIRCALAWIQWSVGVSFPILNQVDTPLPHIESKWVASIRSFLSVTKLTIQVDTDYVPPLQREEDSYIMDSVIQSTKFSPADIRIINYCRLCPTREVTLCVFIFIFP